MTSTKHTQKPNKQEPVHSPQKNDILVKQAETADVKTQCTQFGTLFWLLIWMASSWQRVLMSQFIVTPIHAVNLYYIYIHYFSIQL